MGLLGPVWLGAERLERKQTWKQCLWQPEVTLPSRAKCLEGPPQPSLYPAAAPPHPGALGQGLGFPASPPMQFPFPALLGLT